MKSLFTILFCGILFSTGYSQSKMLPGYIIGQTGDTIHGNIISDNLRGMHSSCHFIPADHNQAVIYKPFEIHAYRIIEGGFFVSKRIRENGENIDVFLEYLVDGITDLYYYSSIDPPNYYIQVNGDSIIGLINTVEKRPGDYVKYHKEYIGILKYSFRDSWEIQSQIDKASLNHRDLSRLAENYHNYVCDEYECISYLKSFKPEISIGFVSAFVHSYLSFNAIEDMYFSYLKDEKFRANSSFSIGFAFSATKIFSLGRNIGLNCLLEYQTQNFSSDSIKIDLRSIRVPIYFDYVFKRDKINPFISAGIANTFWLNSRIQAEPEIKRSDLEYTLGSYQISALVGAGLQFSNKNRFKYQVGSFFEYGSGINSASSVNRFLDSRIISIRVYFKILFNINN